MKQEKQVPSLHEIEKTMATLWLNRPARIWLNSDSGIEELPEDFGSLNRTVLETLDRPGARVYARSLNYEYQDMADCIFPNCARAVGKEWDELVADYYKHFPSRHFDFNKICLNFCTYLQEHCKELLQRYPYLAELADYEWLEQAKSEECTRIERAPQVAIEGLEQVTEYFPVLNQTLTIRHYRYPIAEIASNFEERKRPRKKFSERPSLIAIYRDPETHRTRFMCLGEATARVVETAQQEPTLYQDLLKLTISLTPALHPAQAAVEFLSLIESLHEDNIFIGSLRKEVKHVV